MNLIKYLETYVNTKSAFARFFVILLHMPILAVVMAIHMVEAVVRLINELVTGLITVVSGSLTNAHTFVIEGFKVAGGTVLKVAKGPAKVIEAVAAKVEAPVVAVKAELARAADTAIAAVKADYAEAQAAPVSFAQHVEAAAKGMVNGAPIPAKVAPVATTVAPGAAPVVTVAPVKVA